MADATARNSSAIPNGEAIRWNDESNTTMVTPIKDKVMPAIFFTESFSLWYLAAAIGENKGIVAIIIAPTVLVTYINP